MEADTQRNNEDSGRKMSHFEKLYRDKDKRTESARQLKQKYETSERLSITFEPRLIAKVPERVQNRRGSVADRLYEQQRESIHRLQALTQRVTKEELSDCTFQPSIQPPTRRMSKVLQKVTTRQESPMELSQRLFLDAEDRRKKMEEHASGEVTPISAHVTRLPEDQRNVAHTRLYQHALELQIKQELVALEEAEAKRFLEEGKLKEMFKPQVSNYAKQLERNPKSVFENNYQESIARDSRRREAKRMQDEKLEMMLKKPEAAPVSAPNTPRASLYDPDLIPKREMERGLVKAALEYSQCTFHPEINPTSEVIAKNIQRDQAYLNRKLKIMVQREEAYNQIKEQELTFTPAINMQSKRLISMKRLHSNLAVHERLYSLRTPSNVNTSAERQEQVPKPVIRPGKHIQSLFGEQHVATKRKTSLANNCLKDGSDECEKYVTPDDCFEEEDEEEEKEEEDEDDDPLPGNLNVQSTEQSPYADLAVYLDSYTDTDLLGLALENESITDGKTGDVVDAGSSLVMDINDPTVTGNTQCLENATEITIDSECNMMPATDCRQKHSLPLADQVDDNGMLPTLLETNTVTENDGTYSEREYQSFPEGKGSGMEKPSHASTQSDSGDESIFKGDTNPDSGIDQTNTLEHQTDIIENHSPQERLGGHDQKPKAFDEVQSRMIDPELPNFMLAVEVINIEEANSEVVDSPEKPLHTFSSYLNALDTMDENSRSTTGLEDNFEEILSLTSGSSKRSDIRNYASTGEQGVLVAQLMLRDDERERLFQGWDLQKRGRLRHFRKIKLFMPKSQPDCICWKSQHTGAIRTVCLGDIVRVRSVARQTFLTGQRKDKDGESLEKNGRILSFFKQALSKRSDQQIKSMNGRSHSESAGARDWSPRRSKTYSSGSNHRVATFPDINDVKEKDWCYFQMILLNKHRKVLRVKSEEDRDAVVAILNKAVLEYQQRRIGAELHLR